MPSLAVASSDSPRVGGNGGVSGVRGWTRIWAPSGLYALIALLGYGRILLNPQFLSDDFSLIAQIKHGAGVWDHRGESFFRPVVGTLLAVLWRLAGDRPLAFHVSNLIFLVGAAMLVRTLFIQLTSESLAKRTSILGGLAAGALFAAWPSHSEPVTWIAGMTDTVSVFFGLGSVVLFTEYRRTGNRFLWALSLAALWIGLCAKESLITWPPIVFVIPTVILPGARSGRVTRWALEIASFLFVATSYVIWRTQILGTLIGGYGEQTHLNFNPWDMLEHFGVHVADTCLPGNMQLTLWLGSDFTRRLMTLVAAGLLALFLRRLPRLKLSQASVTAAEWLTIGLFFQRLNLLTNENNLDYYAPRIYGGEAVVLTLFAFFRTKYPSGISALTPKRLNALFWIGAIVAMDIYRVEYLIQRDLAVLFAVFGLGYLSRSTFESKLSIGKLPRVGLGMVFGVALAILPALNLSISLNGESSRFAYGASAFGCIGIVIAGVLLGEDVRFKRAAAASLVIGCTGALYACNRSYVRASEISRMTTEVVRGFGNFRKLFVLAAPDTVDGAYVFRDGLVHLPDVTANDANVQVLVGILIKDARFGDRIQFVGEPGSYLPLLVKAPYDRRLYRPTLLPSPRTVEGGPITLSDGRIVLHGYDPALDRVISIDTESVTTLN